jgi:hypothetical protein
MSHGPGARLGAKDTAHDIAHCPRAAVGCERS